MFKYIFKELLWVLTILLVTTLVVFSFTGNPSLFNGQDIHIDDSILFLSGAWLIGIPFLFLTFIVYFVKEWRKGFERRIPNWIFVITGTLLLPCIAFLTPLTIEVKTRQWNLNETIASQEPTLDTSSSGNPIIFVLLALQVTVSGLLLFVMFKWGRNSRNGTSK